ncbi:flavin-containing monooxygenase [Vallicoccus soli]|uniref:flavin-containing monooxygenase n=1 Tax=Vallicoccus soli TaxID=2339232 RepID=UPI001C49C14A|nr:NAD(P)/FAD-dependent oxidoreductase [Vallicoccus soli]
MLDVLVVGAGQAGLAVGRALADRGADLLLVDAAGAVGDSWRARWDSLRLFTSAEHDALPGRAFPAPRGSYPGKDAVAGYLAAYAQGLPVRTGTPVHRLAPAPGGFAAETPTGTVRARQVVVATGPFQVPRVPALAAGLDVPHLHTGAYRRPSDVPGRRVLVVGAANSGLQVALELARAGRVVTVAVGRRLRRVPQRPLGRDLYWWLTRTGLVTRPSDAPGPRIPDVVVGPSWRALGRELALRGRAVAARGRVVELADGPVEADAVVWATGWRTEHGWFDVPGAVRGGRLVHERGAVPVPGLHVLGLPGMRMRGSALLGFVGHDAAWVARRVLAR